MSEKLSERLVFELKVLNNEHGGFTGWPDTMEEVIDAVDNLEEERDTLQKRVQVLENMLANLKTAGET